MYYKNCMFRKPKNYCTYELLNTAVLMALKLLEVYPIDCMYCIYSKQKMNIFVLLICLNRKTLYLYSILRRHHRGGGGGWGIYIIFRTQQQIYTFCQNFTRSLKLLTAPITELMKSHCFPRDFHVRGLDEYFNSIRNKGILLNNNEHKIKTEHNLRHSGQQEQGNANTTSGQNFVDLPPHFRNVSHEATGC